MRKARPEFGAEFDFVHRFIDFLGTGSGQIRFGVSLQFSYTGFLGKECEQARRVAVRRQGVRFGEDGFHVRFGELPGDVRVIAITRDFPD